MLTRSPMVDSVNAAYVVLLMAAGALLYLVWKMVKRNQQTFIEDNAPAVAGADDLGGQAKDPSQFDEPDEDALEEMADVLSAAAEAQGIDYEE
jgi:hypothetical protein